MDNQMPTQLIRRKTSVMEADPIDIVDYEAKYKKLHKKYKKLKNLCASLEAEIEFLTEQNENLVAEINEYIDNYPVGATEYLLTASSIDECEEDDGDDFLSHESMMLKAEYTRENGVQIARPSNKLSLSRVRLSADPIRGQYRLGFKF